MSGSDDMPCFKLGKIVRNTNTINASARESVAQLRISFFKLDEAANKRRLPFSRRHRLALFRRNPFHVTGIGLENNPASSNHHNARTCYQADSPVQVPLTK
jgi:hypothetical protein